MNVDLKDFHSQGQKLDVEYESVMISGWLDKLSDWKAQKYEQINEVDQSTKHPCKPESLCFGDLSELTEEN